MSLSNEINTVLLKSGDIREFEKLVLLCEKRVYNLALRYANNESDAMDISQEVFLRVYRGLGNFKEESSITTWVYRITVNAAIDMVRKKERHIESSLTGYGEDEEKEQDIIDTSHSPELEYDKIELRETMNSAIKMLSEEHQQVIIMRDINGMNYTEISEILNIEEGTVKSRLFRARSHLRTILTDKGNISLRNSSKNQKGGSLDVQL